MFTTDASVSMTDVTTDNDPAGTALPSFILVSVGIYDASTGADGIKIEECSTTDCA